MRALNIPDPPKPEQFRGNVLGWQRAMVDWGQRVKGVLQDFNRDANKPCGQQLVVGSFTTNTTITGTTTGTDLANYVASMTQAFTMRGDISPTITRGQTQ